MKELSQVWILTCDLLNWFVWLTHSEYQKTDYLLFTNSQSAAFELLYDEQNIWLLFLYQATGHRSDASTLMNNHTGAIIIDLVYFTTRVPDTNDPSATWTTRVQQEWDTSDVNAT